jgi:hypothetical protein
MSISHYFYGQLKWSRELDREFINQLDIPTGLKDLLISRGFTIEQLVNIKSNDMAKALKIDEDVTRLTGAAIKKYIEEQRKRN